MAAGTAAASALVAMAQPATAQPADPAAAAKLAAAKADALVASNPALLKASKYDTFRQHPVISSHGLNYVPYTRTYKGLPVLGGDLVVMSDASGATKYTSVAQSSPIGELSVTPKVTDTAAAATAKKQLKSVSRVEGTSLVVVAAEGAPARLAWQTTVDGRGAEGASRLTVNVDAITGKVLSTKEHVTEVTGSGTGWINGSVSIDTTLSGSTYSMKSSTQPTMQCQDASNNTTFSGTDNVWGNGTGTNRETGCVDALYVGEKQTAMLSAWLGRSGQNGSNGAWPLRVGLNDQNAYYDGTQVQIGKNTAGQWIASADVVGHELGHGIDDNTPGGISGGNTQEFVADTFGAATEWYINNPNDPPDFLVGEEVNLVGSGPIRNMYNPSALGDDNCYSSSIPSEEVHAAAGPGNHWFYLLSQGTSGNGQPSSATCNSSTVTGLGIQKAITIMYNAMLLKTSSSSYLKYRTWTLTAAKSLYPGSCTEFNTVKAAWDAVSVPAQSGDPTCSGSTTPPTTPPTTGPTTTPPTGSNLLGNPGFESGATTWSQTSGVISTASGTNTPRTGTYFAWLDGYGSSHTDTLSQSVTIPSSASSATLSFYLKITTAETTTSTAYDKLTVKAGSTTLATYSNLNKAGYTLRTFDLSSLKGQTVSISFSGVEDSSLQTSFQIDDTSLTVS
ncbi:M4 family metallopeptidase [Actinoplanes sp. KI2]|uniref:M4 family metallopeptidase n=1 Tax=Actinoplanes sp. KI2 TaxID=2983315 RepID=UPI0021D603CF|nr:M4 family metallopeptidase [Actinoplanes sp. KI2]MCU7728559.1 M4 family metallopeptidase [Actinoplanes sp. KI2]